MYNEISSKMNYLDGFIHEILRLHPNSVDCKVCVHDTTLSGGK